MKPMNCGGCWGTTSVLLVLCLATGTRAAERSCEHLFASPTQLWLAPERGPARLLHEDAQGVEHAAWSPSGRRIAYARPFGFASGQDGASLIVLTREGDPVAQLSIPEDTGINAVQHVHWLGEHRLWLDGHVNPSVGVYLEWDVRTGKLRREHLGTHFAPSPNGVSLAQLPFTPHGAPDQLQPREVLIDERTVYRAAGDAPTDWLQSDFVWTADSRHLSWTERRGAVLERVTLDVRRRAVVKRVRLPSGNSPARSGEPPPVPSGKGTGRPSVPGSWQDTRCSG